MPGLLKRLAQLALALCALMPPIAAAHGDHAHPNADAWFARAVHHEAHVPAAGAVAIAPSHCPTEGERACGCHGLSCPRPYELAVIAIAPAACAVRWTLAAPLPAL